MNAYLIQLEAVLAREVELHRQLLDAAETKRRAVIAGDLQLLEDLLAHEQKLIKRVEAEEEKRKALVEELRAGLKLGPGPVKMETIIARAPAPWQEKLATVREELRAVLDRLRHRTRCNAELLHASIEHANAFLRAVQEAAAGHTTYGRDGKRKVGPFRLLNKSA